MADTYVRGKPLNVLGEKFTEVGKHGTIWSSNVKMGFGMNFSNEIRAKLGLVGNS